MYAVERLKYYIESYQGNACVWGTSWGLVRECATLFEARKTYDGILAQPTCWFLPLRIVEIVDHTQPPLGPPNRYWRE